MIDGSTCPTLTELTTISLACFEQFNKDAKWAFQVLDDANNVFADATNGIELESSWTALPDASDFTKVVITPPLEQVNIPRQDVLEGAENYDGAPVGIGAGAQMFSAIIRNPTPAQRIAFDDMQNKLGNKTLTLYRIDNNGKIMSRKVGAADHAGIKISPSTFICLDPEKGENRADQQLMYIQFYLPAGWFKVIDVTLPEATFDPLTEIEAS